MKQHEMALVALAAFRVGAGACRGDVVFTAWLQAPEVVVAGSDFTFSVWVGATGTTIDAENALASFTMDVIASGLAAEFTPANLLVPGFSQGTPLENALRGVSGFNHPSIAPFSTHNPIRASEASVALPPGGDGVLELTLAQTQDWNFMIGWWIDYIAGSSVFDTDPGSSLIVIPATVRGIPAPAGVVILVLGELVRGGRRRRSSRHDPQEVSLVDGSLPFDRACFNRCRPMR